MRYQVFHRPKDRRGKWHPSGTLRPRPLKTLRGARKRLVADLLDTFATNYWARQLGLATDVILVRASRALPGEKHNVTADGDYVCLEHWIEEVPDES